MLPGIGRSRLVAVVYSLNCFGNALICWQLTNVKATKCVACLPLQPAGGKCLAVTTFESVLHTFNPNTHLPGMTLPRTTSVRLNHLCTSVGRFCSCLHKWDMAPSAACEYGTEKQTVDLPMISTARRFWLMRQLNGCSTPAPRSSAAKQWIDRSGSNDNDLPSVIWISHQNHTATVDIFMRLHPVMKGLSSWGNLSFGINFICFTNLQII